MLSMERLDLVDPHNDGPLTGIRLLLTWMGLLAGAWTIIIAVVWGILKLFGVEV